MTENIQFTVPEAPDRSLGEGGAGAGPAPCGRYGLTLPPTIRQRPTADRPAVVGLSSSCGA
ncbi:hypothetical protein [Arthrobacter sp. AZCC_0090]|uniref:hypothetical protein n=1 Tax=Arthrobacter sp. AZCC_0090 TaxID=2735881 RepID=UPI001613ECB4|nr:hypothetical protein [Arthrobacter sp. AZCC_0090]MBB6404723.1 hypothetical protein [Arthrobacter sp. AZCC_0090]